MVQRSRAQRLDSRLGFVIYFYAPSRFSNISVTQFPFWEWNDGTMTLLGPFESEGINFSDLVEKHQRWAGKDHV